MQQTQGLTLNITAGENGHYELLVEAPEKWPGELYTLPFKKAALYDKLNAANKTLTDIIHEKEEQFQQPSEYIRDIDVPEDICISHLERIQNLRLFDFFFRGEDPPYDPTGTQCVNAIRELSSDNKPLRIRINSKEFRFPWALMYDGPKIKDLEKRDVETVSQQFWGFKHIIEEPYRPFTYNHHIRLSESWFSFSVKEDIELDHNLNEFYGSNSGPVREQRKFLRSHGLEPLEYTEKRDLMEALEKRPHDGIIYFYCHAKYEPFESLPSEKSFLQLMKPKNYIDRALERDEYNDKVTLGDLKGIGDTVTHYVKKPLVFINACQSAAISPLSFNSFIPYFVSRGASGVIGTLCEVPIIFASKFALHFFEMLFKGEPVDKTILDTRKRFIKCNNNLLGLYYVSCCSPGLVVEPPSGDIS